MLWERLPPLRLQRTTRKKRKRGVEVWAGAREVMGAVAAAAAAAAESRT